MKLLPFRRTLTDPNGFTITDAVEAKVLKDGGTRFILLRNGVNLFRFDPKAFECIAVAKADQGEFHLVGRPASGQSTSASVLAVFPTARAAENAHAAVAGTYAGLGRRRVARWALALVGAYVVLKLVTSAWAAVPAPQEVGQASRASENVAQAAGASAKAFDASEPTLEDLASGKYRFAPRLEAPAVQAPDLKCESK